MLALLRDPPIQPSSRPPGHSIPEVALVLQPLEELETKRFNLSEARRLMRRSKATSVDKAHPRTVCAAPFGETSPPLSEAGAFAQR